MLGNIVVQMVIMESLILHGSELSFSVVLLPLFIWYLSWVYCCALSQIYSKLVQYPVAGEKQSPFYITMVFNCLIIWMPYSMSEIVFIF